MPRKVTYAAVNITPQHVMSVTREIASRIM